MPLIKTRNNEQQAASKQAQSSHVSLVCCPFYYFWCSHYFMHSPSLSFTLSFFKFGPPLPYSCLSVCTSFFNLSLLYPFLDHFFLFCPSFTLCWTCSHFFLIWPTFPGPFLFLIWTHRANSKMHTKT